MWSYGVVIWEVFSLGASPYQSLKNNQVHRFLVSGERLPRPRQCPEAVFEIALACFSLDPEQRPTFEEVVDSLYPLTKQSFPNVVVPASELLYDAVDDSGEDSGLAAAKRQSVAGGVQSWMETAETIVDDVYDNTEDGFMMNQVVPQQNTYDSVARSGDDGVYDLGGQGGQVERRASRSGNNDIYDTAAQEQIDNDAHIYDMGSGSETGSRKLEIADTDAHIYDMGGAPSLQLTDLDRSVILDDHADYDLAGGEEEA